MKKALSIGLVSAVALSTAAPAFAQYSYRPTDQYQQDLRRYQGERAAYEVRREDYQAARRDYERRRADWERARAGYDARYGYGAYARAYGPAPVWDDAYWAGYNNDASRYGRDTAYTEDCGSSRNNRSVAGGLIGALAGAALGSNVAARNARTEGTVLGAVVGGAIGASVGRASAKCDTRGYYYSYDQTVPYRESAYDRNRSGRYNYSYYTRQRCRLAPAPVDVGYGEEYRYVRVCPDNTGRYRITG